MNNIEIIKPLLIFEDEDTFYHLQIIKRKKEHPELGSNSYVVKTYYVSSIEYLELKMYEIIHLCDFHNARACINLNKRSYEKCGYQMLRKVTDCILNKDFRSIRKSYESVVGKFSSDKDKKWIIDIDVTESLFYTNLVKKLYDIEPIGDKLKAIIPTKNGCHLITSPFNINTYNGLHIWETDDKPEIHKNNPTLLYWKD